MWLKLPYKISFEKNTSCPIHILKTTGLIISHSPCSKKIPYFLHHKTHLDFRGGK